MNKDKLQGKLKILTGEMKKQWGKLTDDDLSCIEGNVDLLIGKLQERYGVVKEKAQHQIDAWMKKIKVGLDA